MVLVMVLLLPLRVWAGDFMSVRMAAGGTPPAMSAAMPADCPMLSQPDTAGAGDGGGSTSAGMADCMSCDLCIPVAEVARAPLEAISFARHALPPTVGVAFASAPPAPAFKPPIP
jgi:hypothetical protein